MKNVIQMLVVLFALIVSNTASAKLTTNAVQQSGFDNLTAEQQAHIVQQVAKMSESTQSPAAKIETSIDVVDKWVNIGERIGKMLGGAAKEVGIAANEFAKTDVGRWTMLLIVWNYMGDKLMSLAVHVGSGILFLIIGVGIVRSLVNRSIKEEVVYDKTTKNIFGNYPVLSKTKESMDGDTVTGFAFAYLAVIVISLLTIVAY